MPTLHRDTVHLCSCDDAILPVHLLTTCTHVQWKAWERGYTQLSKKDVSTYIVISSLDPWYFTNYRRCSFNEVNS